MRIGFSSIYSWRPHVEHTWYLASLAMRAGHEVRFLTCDSDLPTCYTRQMRDRNALRECMQCRIGGIRSYASQHVSSIADHFSEEAQLSAPVREWAHSSASTLGRFESPEDYASAAFQQLVDDVTPTVHKAYVAALNWVKREKLDAVCLFNGRMDATRAIYEAAKACNIPVVSHERTWFGNGIQLLPGENCLGLANVWNMVDRWKDKPLTQVQAHRAASLVARRFLKQNQNEWRAYNQSAIDKPWQVPEGKRRVLILPSSTNEIWGHPDWASGWTSLLDAFDAIIARLQLQPDELILRCHPNWGEKIGKNDGRLPERFYTDWAKQRGIRCISSTDRTSTMHLIEQCDALVVSVGSAALEAGTLGKPVISVAQSIYHTAGFTYNVHHPDQLAVLDPLRQNTPAAGSDLSHHITSQALRFAYAMVWRLPQYVDFIRAKSPTNFEYIAGADPQKLITLIQQQRLEADDPTYDTTGVAGENAVIRMIAARQWEDLIGAPQDTHHPAAAPLNRRGFYKVIDHIRKISAVGDR